MVPEVMRVFFTLGSYKLAIAAWASATTLQTARD